MNNFLRLPFIMIVLILTTSCVNPSIVALARGRYYEMQGEHEKAIEEFSSAIHFDPQNVEAHYHRGWCLEQKHDYGAAVRDFDYSIGKWPKSSGAYFNRGYCYASLGKNSLALTDYEVAVRLDPSDSSIWFQKAWTEDKMDKQELALADYTHAIQTEKSPYRSGNTKFGGRRSKQDSGYHYYRGLSEWHLNRLPQAVADFDASIAANHHDPNGYLLRAGTYFNMNKPELAIDDAISCVHLLKADRKTKYLPIKPQLSAADEAHLLPYALIIGYLSYAKLNQRKEGEQFLAENISAVESNKWPLPVIRYLKREISDSDLFAAIERNSNDEWTEASCYVGLNQMIAGQRQEGLKHLSWVKDHGNHGFIEYYLALSALASNSAPIHHGSS